MPVFDTLTATTIEYIEHLIKEFSLSNLVERNVVKYLSHVNGNAAFCLPKLQGVSKKT